MSDSTYLWLVGTPDGWPTTSGGLLFHLVAGRPANSPKCRRRMKCESNEFLSVRPPVLPVRADICHVHVGKKCERYANGYLQSGLKQGWNDLFLTCWRSLEELRGDYHQALVDPTEATLFALAQAVEQRDRQTAGHCERIAFLSVALGIVYGLDRRDLLCVYRGAYLHDIGKVGIPDSVLLKPGRLDADEWEVMKTHSIRGVEICRHLKSLDPVIPIIRYHHERWDGSGYPDGLAGENIPLLARVVQMADIYDALRRERPYKPAFTAAEAIAIIDDEAARGWRDPALSRGFAPSLSRGALALGRSDALGMGTGTDPRLAEPIAASPGAKGRDTNPADRAPILICRCPRRRPSGDMFRHHCHNVGADGE